MYFLAERLADVVKTVFVGNLPTTTKKQHLYKLFKKCGAIHSVRLRTADGKKLSRKEDEMQKTQSFNAYIVFKDQKSTAKALKISGQEFKNQHIRVTMSDIKANEQDSKNVLFVGNLKYSKK